jgi:diaminopimelate epimerase
MRLTKHHGLGNDFLVLLDPAAEQTVTPAVARAACDRHRGLGADGFLHATDGSGGADVTMALYNADGGRAEMSGNGIRCLGQAVVQAGWATGPRLIVSTDAGARRLAIRESDDPRTHLVSVDMGAVEDQGDTSEWVGEGIVAAAWANMGNPHLVLYAPEPEAAPDLVRLGTLVNQKTPGGVNVEIISSGPRTDELTLSVFERGVGITLACGTGACAAAAVAHRWGLVDGRTKVHMPGGSADVWLGDTVTLGGPTVSIAAVEFPWP